MDKLILFHINEQMYGINVEFVNAIETVADIVRVPNAPNYIEGIIHLRGDVIPVYSLRNKLNLERSNSEKEPQLIITRSGVHVFAFVVDGVDEIYEMNGGSYIEPPMLLQSEATSYIEGIANVEGKLVLGINVDALMNETEKDNMKRFVEQLSQSDQ